MNDKLLFKVSILNVRSEDRANRDASIYIHEKVKKIETAYISFTVCFKFKHMFQLFFSLLVVAVCEAGVITNVDHSHHAVYHGLGATSYQNVQVDNHDAILVPANYGDPAEIQEHYDERIIPIVESHNDIDHVLSHSGKSTFASQSYKKIFIYFDIFR